MCDPRPRSGKPDKTAGPPVFAQASFCEQSHPESPLVTVIVPTWNSETDVIDFLESVSRQTYPKESIELVAIDNGSKDRSVEVISEWFRTQRTPGWHRLQLIELPTNQGIAKAYNLGYKSCSPQSYAILRGEADVLLEPEVIEILCRALREEASIGVAGARGLLYGTNPAQLDHAAGYMNWWNGRLRRVDPPKLVDCDSVLGPTFLIRRTCINEMRFFFPEDRFLASELEFCTRIKRSGYRVVCEPAAVSHHKSGMSTRHLNSGRFGYIGQRETVLFHLKYNPYPQKIMCLAWNVAWSLKQAIKGQKMLILGVRDGIRWWLWDIPPQLPGSAHDMPVEDWLAQP
jgi:GT2 family glycosyltransferase